MICWLGKGSKYEILWHLTYNQKKIDQIIIFLYIRRLTCMCKTTNLPNQNIVCTPLQHCPLAPGLWLQSVGALSYCVLFKTKHPLGNVLMVLCHIYIYRTLRCSSPASRRKSSCLASLLALVVLILSIHLYSGSSSITSSSTKPLICGESIRRWKNPSS